MFKFEDQFSIDEPEGQIEAVSKKLETIGQLARKCLASSDFQQYKDLFEKEKDAVINVMVVYTANFGKDGTQNLEMYAFNMMRFVQQITDLRKLLTAVELDARKGTQPKENEDGKVRN